MPSTCYWRLTLESKDGTKSQLVDWREYLSVQHFESRSIPHPVLDGAARILPYVW